MNIKRLALAIVAAFIYIFVSDILIHGVWLVDEYKSSMGLWRPETEMQAHMPWMTAGQLLAAVTFVTLWAVGFAARATIRCACLFGLFMGLFHQANTLITFAVQPLPASLATKWFVACTLQAVLLGVVTFLAYKPLASAEPGK